ncbi:MAG: DUF192 domain-containing protein [Actinomycetota bacterium]|nr:DUF192 domain-containing protein [Actinomycetota bacterium]
MRRAGASVSLPAPVSVLVGALVLAASCGGGGETPGGGQTGSGTVTGTGNLAGLTTVDVEIVAENGVTTPCCVWLADDPDERSKGLMGVTDLRRAAGMVFVFTEDRFGAFYMYDTPMPLSIAFFDADGAFVSAADMTPCTRDDAGDCPRYRAARPYRTAVEVPVGTLADLGIGPGSRLRVVPGTETAAPCRSTDDG